MATHLQLAEAQFLGFLHAKSGYSIKDLARAMALTRSEWRKLRDTLSITEEQKREVDSLFQ